MADSEAVEHTLAVARAALTAPTGARARVRSALVARGAFGAASGSSAVAGKSAGVTQLTTILLVGMSFGAGYWLGVHRSGEHAAPPAASAATEPVQASAPLGSEAMRSAPRPLERSLAVSAAEVPGVIDSTPIVTTPAAAAAGHDAPLDAIGPRPRPRATTKAGAVSSAASDRFARELALLQRAERAIRAGEAKLALSFVDELDRHYPTSSLSEERGAARLMAECLDSKPGAKARAAHFLRVRTTSVYSDRLRRSCELGDLPSAPAQATELARPDTDRVKE
jgi:hypothetical protein